jgi:hypothetical protein
MKPLNAIGTMQLNRREGYCLYSVNPKIHPLSAVVTAAKRLSSKLSVMLDGDPDHEILIEIRPRQKVAIEEAAMMFSSELMRCTHGNDTIRKR